jgi:hypothetical protein
MGILAVSGIGTIMGAGGIMATGAIMAGGIVTKPPPAGGEPIEAAGGEAAGGCEHISPQAHVHVWGLL